jgi:hypothetical protein
MWNIKTEAVPSLIRVNRFTSKSSKNYLYNIPGNQDIKEPLKKPHSHCGQESAKTKLQILSSEII